MPVNRTGLILSGGGARASYQVGVLKAVAEILGEGPNNPFKVINGSSAGAINAASLACRSDNFAEATRRLESLWGHLASEDIHRVGFGELIKSTLNLIFSFFRRGVASRPLFLLDNSPLRRLLHETIDLTRLPARLEAGDIWALGIAALEYSTGQTIHFFQGNSAVEEWERQRRIGIKTTITYDHLMASAAIPGVYPAVKVEGQYFGDGAFRETAPMSAALHMGANKLFLIGSSHNPYENGEGKPSGPAHAPSAAQIVGHLFNRSFLDTMEEDVERLERLNDVVERLSPGDREELGIRPVEFMSVIPGVRVDQMAARHISSLPASMRTFFRTIGASGENQGASVASYLMFERPFLEELMEQGYRDGMEKREEIAAFLAPDDD